MRKQTDLAKVKQTALALLSTEINETPYSPMIVKHPFTDTGVSAIPDGKGGVDMIDLTEDDAQLKWRQSILCTAKAEYHGKVEYLYLPCERAAIDKSIGRLGAPDADSVSIILDDFMVDNPEWMRRLREMTTSESIYDINDLVGAISNADMQLDKLTAVAEYAGVEDAKSITALANSLGLFTLVEDAEDHEDVGKHFVEHDPEYSVSETIEDFVNYDLLGEHIADELNGLFVSSGFVCMESGYSMSDVLDTEQGIRMRGM